MGKYDKAPRGSGSAGMRKGTPYDDIPDPSAPAAPPERCPTCEGTGQFTVLHSEPCTPTCQYPFNTMMAMDFAKCPYCAGTGQRRDADGDPTA